MGCSRDDTLSTWSVILNCTVDGGTSDPERGFFKIGGGGETAAEGVRAGLMEGPALAS